LFLQLLKKIMLLDLIHMLDRPHHGLGHIFAIIHLRIIVVCICAHIWSNTLLLMQIMVHYKDHLLLTITWSEVHQEKKRAARETQNTHSRGGVPQACLVLKKLWRPRKRGSMEHKQWPCQQGHYLLSRYGGQRKSSLELRASLWPIRWFTTWKTAFGNGRRSPLVMGNAPVTDQVLQISQER
jgi:hypothetical protein